MKTEKQINKHIDTLNQDIDTANKAIIYYKDVIETAQDRIDILKWCLVTEPTPVSKKDEQEIEDDI
jgi:hypothetical protein